MDLLRKTLHWKCYLRLAIEINLLLNLTVDGAHFYIPSKNEKDPLNKGVLVLEQFG